METRNVSPALMEAIQAYGRAVLAAQAAADAVTNAREAQAVAAGDADLARDHASAARSAMLAVAEAEGFFGGQA